MPRWLPWRRERTPDPGVVEILQDAYGKGAVSEAGLSTSWVKQPGAGGGLLAGVVRLLPRERSGQRRSEMELLKAYATMPWVRAVVGKISEGIAATEWQAFRLVGAGERERSRFMRRYVRCADVAKRRRMRDRVIRQGQAEFVEIPEALILDVLERGNEFHNGHLLAELTQAHLELVGEAYWLKERDSLGRPTDLWGLPPYWVTKTPAPGTGLDHFELTVNGVRTPVPMSEIVYFQKPNPFDPYRRGVGYGHALSDEIDTDEYAAKHIKSWFINGAIPDLLVTADGLQKEDAERFEQRWLEKSQGFWNRFKPHFVNKKVTVEKLNATFREMGVNQLRKDERDIFIHVWGVAPEIFGITSSSNRATIEGAFFQFARWVLVPRLEFKRVFLQTRLVPDFQDPGLVLDYVSPVEEDKEHQLKVLQAAPWAAKVDEIRAMASLDPLPDGKGQVHGAPFQLVFVEELGGAAGGSAPEPTGGDDPPEPEGGASDDAPPGERTPPRLPRRDAQRTAPRQRQLTDDQQQLVERVARAVLTGTVRGKLKPHLAEITEAFGSSASQDLGVEFNVSDPAVVDYLEHGYETQIRDLNGTTRDKLRSTLARGLEGAESMEQLAGRVEDVFEVAEGSRARLIARSATTNAANFGNQAAFTQAGVPRKEWIAVRDGDTRDTHVGLDVAEPIPVADHFVSASGASGPHPGALGSAAEDANCRCTMGAVLEDAEGRAVSPLNSESKREAAWRTFEAERFAHEGPVVRSLRDAFGEQKAAALAALRGG